MLVLALIVNIAADHNGSGRIVGDYTGLFVIAASLSATSLNISIRLFGRRKYTVSMPHFPHLCVWRTRALISSAISLSAALWDRTGGLWGASRHAVTVEFISHHGVFDWTERVLPAFCGMRVLLSPLIMFASLALLNAGCVLRVVSEIGAYEGYMPSLWPILPVSAVVVDDGCNGIPANLLLTFIQPAAHLQSASSR